MYGRYSADPAVLDEMSTILVSPIPDHQGQLVRNALITALSPLGEPDRPRYRLAVVVSVGESTQALRTDDTATRATDYYSTRFILYDGNTAITSGGFTNMFSYDFLEEHYANVSAAEDVRHRAATLIAETIRNQLAGYFVHNAKVKAAQAVPK
jgi:LPS-assembly lipoprotein